MKVVRDEGLAQADVELHATTNHPGGRLFDAQFFSGELDLAELADFRGRLDIAFVGSGQGNGTVYVSPEGCESPPHCGTRNTRLRVEEVSCSRETPHALRIRGVAPDSVAQGWRIGAHPSITQVPGAPWELELVLQADVDGCTEVQRGKPQPFAVTVRVPGVAHDRYLLSVLQPMGWERERWTVDFATCAVQPTLEIDI